MSYAISTNATPYTIAATNRENPWEICKVAGYSVRNTSGLNMQATFCIPDITASAAPVENTVDGK